MSKCLEYSRKDAIYVAVVSVPLGYGAVILLFQNRSDKLKIADPGTFFLGLVRHRTVHGY